MFCKKARRTRGRDEKKIDICAGTDLILRMDTSTNSKLSPTSTNAPPLPPPTGDVQDMDVSVDDEDRSLPPQEKEKKDEEKKDEKDTDPFR